MSKLNSRRVRLYKRIASKDYFLNSLFWIVLVVGILSLAGGLLIDIYWNQKWGVVFSTIGQVALVSILFSAISKSDYFLDFFSEIIEEIIYYSGHIDHRDDKEEIWNRTTQSLFKSKIPGLHDEISKTISDTYIPKAEVSYYNNYRQIIKLTWADREKKILKMEDKFSFELHTNDDSKFPLERDTWVHINEAVKFDQRRKLILYKVNGIDRTADFETIEVQESEKHIEGAKCYKDILYIEGCTKYTIEQKTERNFCLDDDNYSGFLAKWLVNDMDVRVSHPSDIDVRYIPRGTNHNFNIVKNEPDCLDIEYKGLILRNQGYLLLLKEIR